MNFTTNKKSWQIYSSGVSASSSASTSNNGSSGVYHPSVTKTNVGLHVVDGKSAHATTKGYCRLRLSFSAKVNHNDSYVTFSWGSAAAAGRNLTASWKNEFYISNFFANGFCLGIRKDKYVLAYKDGNDDMHFEMEEEGIGFKFSKNGIQTKHHNGNWMSLPMLVWKAKIRRNTTGGNDYYIDFQKSFNTDTISSSSISRIEPSSNHIHMVIPFPTSWQPLNMSDGNAIVNLNGYGDAMIKGTLVSISHTGMTVELSDGASAADGTLLIELFII